MRLQILFILFVFFGSNAQAQKNFTKVLQSEKWYQEKTVTGNTEQIMIFKKINGKAAINEKTSFYANGHIKRCFFEIEGIEPSGASNCDSSFTYQVKKDLIHISDHGLMHVYYKMKAIENGLELKPIAPEIFYKK